MSTVDVIDLTTSPSTSGRIVILENLVLRPAFPEGVIIQNYLLGGEACNTEGLSDNCPQQCVECEPLTSINNTLWNKAMDESVNGSMQRPHVFGLGIARKNINMHGKPSTPSSPWSSSSSSSSSCDESAFSNPEDIAVLGTHEGLLTRVSEDGDIYERRMKELQDDHARALLHLNEAREQQRLGGNKMADLQQQLTQQEKVCQQNQRIVAALQRDEGYAAELYQASRQRLRRHQQKVRRIRRCRKRVA